MQTLQQTTPLAVAMPCRAVGTATRTARPSLSLPRQRRGVVMRTAEEKVVEQASAAQPSVSGLAVPDADVEWVPVLAPEDLPKGVRKEVRVNGQTLLLFWYRNQIYCTEARSPAEGAYSEGLIKGKFTQDFSIECPTTGTLYSLKDGSIVEWYPSNSVLRAITPRSRALELYPVKLAQDGIYISLEAGTQGGVGARSTKGGADSSIEANNVFSLEPKMYVQEKEDESPVGTVVTVVVALLGFGALGVGGFVLGIYYESQYISYGSWGILALAVATLLLQRFNKSREEQ